MGSRIFSTDYVAFETHFVRIIMESCEFQLFDYMTQNLPDHDEFMRLMREVIGGMNVCQFRNFILKVMATRMSGEMDTSLANGFNNLMNFLFMCEEKKCTSVRGKIEGDDGIFTLYGDAPTAADFEKLGFMLKLQEHQSLTTASFCGIVADTEERVIIVSPVEELLNFGWTRREYVGASKHKLKKLLLSKSISLAYQYPGCPILNSLANYGLRMSQGATLYIGAAAGWWEREMLIEAFNYFKREGGVPSKPTGPNTRLLVEKLYGISIQDQIDIERYLDNKNDLSPICLPQLDLLCHADQSHYYTNYVKRVEVKNNEVLYRPEILNGTSAGEMSTVVGTGRRRLGRKAAARPRRGARRGYNKNYPAPNIVGGEQAWGLPQRAPRPRKRRVRKNKSPGLDQYIAKGIRVVQKALTGFGDYRIAGNSIMGGDPPSIINSTSGFIVRHREYIGDVVATTGFTLQTFPINVALSGTFPWLSATAQNFENYKMRGLVFEYKSTSSDAVLSSATSSALGTVIMATQYDPLDPAFPDKRVMENYEFANSSKPSLSFYHPVECSKNQNTINEYFTRAGAIPANADLRLYDVGLFNVATTGMQAAGGVIGELWATFEVELLKPKMVEGQGDTENTDHWQLGAVINSGPLGSTSKLQTGSFIGTTITSSRILTFPGTIVDGQFMIMWAVSGGATAITNPVLTNTTNCSFVSIWAGDTSSNFSIPNGTTTAVATYNVVLKITGPNAVLTFGNVGTLPTAVTSGDLWITKINDGILTVVDTPQENFPADGCPWNSYPNSWDTSDDEEDGEKYTYIRREMDDGTRRWVKFGLSPEYLKKIARAEKRLST